MHAGEAEHKPAISFPDAYGGLVDADAFLDSGGVFVDVHVTVMDQPVVGIHAPQINGPGSIENEGRIRFY